MKTILFSLLFVTSIGFAQDEVNYIHASSGHEVTILNSNVDGVDVQVLLTGIHQVTKIKIGDDSLLPEDFVVQDIISQGYDKLKGKIIKFKSIKNGIQQIAIFYGVYPSLEATVNKLIVNPDMGLITEHMSRDHIFHGRGRIDSLSTKLGQGYLIQMTHFVPYPSDDVKDQLLTHWLGAVVKYNGRAVYIRFSVNLEEPELRLGRISVFTEKLLLSRDMKSLHDSNDVSEVVMEGYNKGRVLFFDGSSVDFERRAGQFIVAYNGKMALSANLVPIKREQTTPFLENAFLDAVDCSGYLR